MLSSSFWFWSSKINSGPVKSLSYIGCVRLASLGRPRCVRIALASFQGLTRVSPQCLACEVGHLGVTRCAWRYHKRVSMIARLSLVRGSPEWAPGDRPREANRTHPMCKSCDRVDFLPPVNNGKYCLEWSLLFLKSIKVYWLCCKNKWYILHSFGGNAVNKKPKH